MLERGELSFSAEAMCSKRWLPVHAAPTDKLTAYASDIITLIRICALILCLPGWWSVFAPFLSIAPLPCPSSCPRPR